MPTSQPGKDLAPILDRMPDPQELRRAIREALEAAYQAARREIGEVHQPEDTYPLQRSLATAWERFSEYSQAFKDGLKRIGGMQQEMLVETVGEQDGIPNQGLTIPDRDGDVQLSLNNANAYDFDLDQLIGVIVARVVHDPDVGDRRTLVEAGIRELLELGKFEPQVSKVTAYAKQVARDGDDTLSAVVRGAVHKRTEFKGLKYERKSP